jgi:hypothetical protein
LHFLEFVRIIYDTGRQELKHQTHPEGAGRFAEIFAPLEPGSQTGREGMTVDDHREPAAPKRRRMQRYGGGYSIAESAKKLQVSEGRLRRAVDRGEVRTVEFGRIRRITARELARVQRLLSGLDDDEPRAPVSAPTPARRRGLSTHKTA